MGVQMVNAQMESLITYGEKYVWVVMTQNTPS